MQDGFGMKEPVAMLFSAAAALLLSFSPPGLPAYAGTGCCAPTAPSTDAPKKTYTAEEIQQMVNGPIEPGCDPERFAQAKVLIEGYNNYIRNAKALHERMEENILIAKTLKGETNLNINNMPVTNLKLQGPALQSAIRQYAADLQSFANNVQMYQANVARFQRDIGECQASQAEYDRQRALYSLHANQFHVPNLGNIAPPHICGALDITQSEAGAISAQLRADEQRLTSSMGNLGAQNALVSEGRNLARTNLANTVRNSIRDQEEQKLSGQFGRLKEEFELLNIQRQALDPNSQKQAGGMVRMKVTGTVK